MNEFDDIWGGYLLHGIGWYWIGFRGLGFPLIILSPEYFCFSRICLFFAFCQNNEPPKNIPLKKPEIN